MLIFYYFMLVIIYCKETSGWNFQQTEMFERKLMLLGEQFFPFDGQVLETKGNFFQ